MDKRKLNFLIGVQRQIDLLESQKGDNSELEKLKARFYDLINLENIIGGEQKVSIDRSYPVLDNSLAITSNDIEKDHTNKCKHKPENFSAFLRKFRVVDDDEFKWLLHENSDVIDLKEILDKLYNKYLFPNDAHYNNRLPFYFWQHVRIDLFEKYKNEGLKFWENNNTQPYNASGMVRFTSDIDKFKRSIRFGNDLSQETKLRDILNELIINVEEAGRYIHNIYNIESLIFLKDENEFDLEADFLTDVPRVKQALRIILRLIIRKSNYKGNVLPIDKPLTDKRLKIELKSIKEDKIFKSQLRITDVHSRCSKKPDNFLSLELQGDIGTIRNYLWSVCDFWIDTVCCDGNAYRFNLMYPTKADKVPAPILLPNAPEGFTYILTFPT